jgi:hypothetical protein
VLIMAGALDQRDQAPGAFWVMGFAATAGVGWTVNLVPMVGPGRVQGLAVVGLFVALAALIAGALQVLILRRSVSGAWAWVPYSAVGALVGYACMMLVGVPLAQFIVTCPIVPNGWGSARVCSAGQASVELFVVFAVAGAGFGAVQARLLRRWVDHAWLCIFFSAFALALAVAFFPPGTLGGAIHTPGGIAKVFGAGTLGGLVKGAGLAFLLRTHRR